MRWAQTPAPVIPPQGRTQGRNHQGRRAPGRGVHQQIIRPGGPGPEPGAAGVGLGPEGDRGQGNDGPGCPEGIGTYRQGQGQGEQPPQGEELPGVGPGLIGLAEVGQEAADAEQRQQPQGRAGRGQGRGPQAGRRHQPLEQAELCDPAQGVPVGGDPQDQPQARQRSRQQGQAAGQPEGQPGGLGLQPGEFEQAPGRCGVEAMAGRQGVEGGALVHLGDQDCRRVGRVTPVRAATGSGQSLAELASI